MGSWLVNDGVFCRSGTTMGVSTATGLGWVSNNKGKPTTAIDTSTTAPVKR
jgi:hypothetical protein